MGWCVGYAGGEAGKDDGRVRGRGSSLRWVKCWRVGAATGSTKAPSLQRRYSPTDVAADMVGKVSWAADHTKASSF